MVKTAKKTKIPLTKAEDYAREVASNIQGGEVIALIGELGAGKTTFTKALGKALGVKQSIPSPTFVMMQEFPTTTKSKVNSKRKLYLYHLDLYRTKDFKEVESLGITQTWTHPETVTVIEWADKILNKLPKNSIVIYLYRDAAANKN